MRLQTDTVILLFLGFISVSGFVRTAVEQSTSSLVYAPPQVSQSLEHANAACPPTDPPTSANSHCHVAREGIKVTSNDKR